MKNANQPIFSELQLCTYPTRGISKCGFNRYESLVLTTNKSPPNKSNISTAELRAVARPEADRWEHCPPPPRPYIRGQVPSVEENLRSEYRKYFNKKIGPEAHL